MELVISCTCVISLHIKFYIPSPSKSLGSHQTEVQRHLAMSTSWHFTLNKSHHQKLHIYSIPIFYVFGRESPPVGPGPPHSRGFYITHNDAAHSVGLLRTSDQLVAETSTWQHTTITTDKHPCPPVGFELKISAGERPQTYALDRVATGTGSIPVRLIKKIPIRLITHHFRPLGEVALVSPSSHQFARPPSSCFWS